MNSDKITGVAKHVEGSIKEATGKLVGDVKLEAEGKADKVVGKLHEAAGDLKDAAKEG